MKYKDIKNELREGMKVKMSRCAKPIGIYRLAGGVWDFRIDDCFHILSSNQDAEWEILTEADGVTPYKGLCTDPCDCDDLKSKPKFKVGDRVRVTNSGQVYDTYEALVKVIHASKWERGNICLNGDEGVIVQLTKHLDNEAPIALIEVLGKEVLIGTVGIEKIEDAPQFSMYYPSNYQESRERFIQANWGSYLNHSLIFNEPQAQKKGIFMNIVDKIKNFKLSAEDRILRENGLEDDNGKITEEAKIMMHEEMRDERWATRRLEIAADLLKIKAEEK